MSTTEIILIIAGVIVLALGYMLPARKRTIDEDLQLASAEEAKKLVDKEMEDVKENIADIVDETITYSMEKAERSMERLTNEKIMAVNEYSDTVLEEINKNHKEVLFLYDMLNDKEESLKNAVSDALRLAEEIKQTVKDAEITARETKEAVSNMELAAREAEETVQSAEALPRKAENFVPFVPPRVEITHNPDADYDYVAAETTQETLTEEDYGLARMAPLPEEEKTEEKQQAETENFHLFRENLSEANLMNNQPENEKMNTRNSNDRILELHKAGKSNMAIAKELGLGIGEVKLVIDLFEGLG